MVRTNWIHGHSDDRGLAVFASSSRVDGSDSVFVFQTLDQPRGAEPSHGDRVLAYWHPSVGTSLLTLNYVAGNGGATVVLWCLPCQGHALAGHINHLWSAGRSRDSCGYKEWLELLEST